MAQHGKRNIAALFISRPIGSLCLKIEVGLSQVIGFLKENQTCMAIFFKKGFLVNTRITWNTTGY